MSFVNLDSLLYIEQSIGKRSLASVFGWDFFTNGESLPLPSQKCPYERLIDAASKASKNHYINVSAKEDIFCVLNLKSFFFFFFLLTTPGQML